jgi:Mn2+/Fe2+ NRAMP family transporter
VFLVGAFCVLYSTAFAATASNSRLLADALSVFGVVKYATPRERERMIRIGCVALPALAVGLYFVWERPVLLVLIGGLGQGMLLPFLAGAALYFRYKRTDARLAPGRWWSFCLWVSALALMTAGGYQVWSLAAGLWR